MRYMMRYRPGVESDVPPTREHMEEMGAYIAEMMQAGVLLAADGLQSSAKGARVRMDDGGFTVTDGPLAETKELVAGFAIVRAGSKEEAIAHARRFLEKMGRGETEIRLMQEMPPMDEAFA